MSRLAKALAILPGEGRLVFLLLLQFVLFGASSIFIQTAAYSLFLTEFSGQSLAYTYLINAAIASIFTLVLLKLSHRLSFGRLLVINQGFMLVLTIAFRAGLAFEGARWIIFLLPALYQLVVNRGITAFWSLAARLFDVRQSKRLFGIVGAGQWISIVLIGLVMQPIVSGVGAANLLLFAILALACAMVLIYYITRAYASRLSAPVPVAAATAQPSIALRSLLKSRYVLLILALVSVWWLSFYFIDNLFYREAVEQFPDAGQLAVFLGGFNALLGILTLVNNFVITRPLISRLGMRTSLLILPVALLIVSLGTVVSSMLGAALALSFGLMVLTKLLDKSMGLSFDRSAQTILYQPLPASDRSRVQAFADGVVQPLAIGLTGMAIIVLNALFPSAVLPVNYALLIAVLGWVIIAAMLGREYAVMLLSALTKRSLVGMNEPLADASSVGILTKSLQNPHPGIALYALNMLEDIAPESYDTHLPDLLSHPSSEVRHEALRRIEQHRMVSALPTLLKHAVAESPETQNLIWRVLVILGDASTTEYMLTRLDDRQVSLRRAAIAGLLRSHNSSAVEAASQKLRECSVSLDPVLRVLAAQLIGELEMRQFLPQMMDLLCDSVPAVRRMALRSAGQLKYPELWSLVMLGLTVPQVRKAAMSALVAGGDSALQAVIKTFNDSAHRNPAILLHQAQIAGRIGGASAIGLLKEQLEVPDVDVRAHVIRALAQCGYRAQAGEAHKIKDHIRDEISMAAWLLAISSDIGNSPETAMTQSALHWRMELSRENVFYLLSCIYDPRIIQRAHDNLRNGGADRKAYALELLDIQIEPDMRRMCFALLEELQPAQRLRQLHAIFPQVRQSREARLQELINAKDRVSEWVVSCARYGLELLHSSAGRAGGSNASTLSLVDVVIFLKKVPIFAQTPDDVLADVARVMEEVEHKAGAPIFEKGDAGDCLYLIVEGRVRVHDGEHTLNHLSAGHEFGETALLEPGTRTASVTAVEDARLLRLDHDTFNELMEDRPEVSQGVIRVLSRFLRERLHDLSELRSQKRQQVA